MQEIRDLAIVLRSVPYEDRHRVVTALTEHHGMVSALARNSVQSRRFGGSLEPFAASVWHFTQKPACELLRLEQATIRRSYEGLRGDFDRLALASLFNELALKFAPGIENSSDFFRVHSNALAWLEEAALQSSAQDQDLALLNGYLSKALQWCGNQPQLSSCLICEIALESLSEDVSVNCVIADAGWICARCRGEHTHHLQNRQKGSFFSYTSLRVTAAAIRDFQMSLGLPIRQIPALSSASHQEHLELFQFLEALLAYHLPAFDPSTLKSLRFLNFQANPAL